MSTRRHGQSRHATRPSGWRECDCLVQCRGRGRRLRLRRKQARELAAAVEGDASLGEHRDEDGAIEMSRSHHGEVGRVGLRPSLGPRASRSMSRLRVGAELPLGAVVGTLQRGVADEGDELAQMSPDAPLQARHVWIRGERRIVRERLEVALDCSRVARGGRRATLPCDGPRVQPGEPVVERRRLRRPTPGWPTARPGPRPEALGASGRFWASLPPGRTRCPRFHASITLVITAHERTPSAARREAYPSSVCFALSLPRSDARRVVRPRPHRAGRAAVHRSRRVSAKCHGASKGRSRSFRVGRQAS